MKVSRNLIKITLLLALSAYAEGVELAGFSMQLMNPQCFPKGATAPSDINVNVLGTMAPGTQDAVAGVLERMKQVGGGAHLLRGKLTVRIHDGGRATKGGKKTCASYSSGNSTVELVQNCRGPSDFNHTAAHLAHEVGHAVGQNGFYGSYAKVEKCNITRYCSHNDNPSQRNEEFAEVFATYLHAPDKLAKQCPAAFKFMRENVFRFGPDPAATCTGIATPNLEGPAEDGYGYSDTHGFGALQKGITDAMLQMLLQQQEKTPPPPSPQMYYPPNNMPRPQPPVPQQAPVNPWPATFQ